MTDLPMTDAGRNGAISWVDLSTPNAGEATDFYGRLLGWTFATTSTPMGDYYVASNAHREVGGLMEPGGDQPASPPMWTVFFTVHDIDATVTGVELAGGTVLQRPFEIPGGARVAVAADPSGAMFAVIGGGPEPSGPYLRDEPGAVGWVEVLTRDPLADVGFYETLFGWSTHTDESTGYTTFALDGTTVCGMLPMPAEVPEDAPSHWATYFTVTDCTTTERRCAELGGEVHRSATDVGGMRFAVLADPHGAMFSVIEFATAEPG